MDAHDDVDHDLALHVRGLTVRFGGLVANDDVTLRVRRRELRAIIGPNGAGKTTLFNAINGDVPLESGQVAIGGRDVTGVPPHRMRAAGLARAYQVPQVFAGMTVRRNLWIAHVADTKDVRRPLRRADDLSATTTRVDEVAEAVGLTAVLDRTADELSHADQKVLDIGIALMLDPEVLLLDEPTQGVSPEEIGAIHRVVTAATQRCTVLMIEHNMETVLGLSDHVTVLADGAVVADGTPEDIMEDEHVQRIYLGPGTPGGTDGADHA